jgi:hypothetical protein
MIFVGGMILGAAYYVAPRFLDYSEQQPIAGVVYRFLGMSLFFISLMCLLTPEGQW